MAEPKRAGIPTTAEPRHNFCLSPYQDAAFTRCATCDTKTKVRKFPLLIYVEPRDVTILNKVCRYCEACDLILVRRGELEQLLYMTYLQRSPHIIGNPYFVYGTMDRADWRRGQRGDLNLEAMLKRAHPFSQVWKVTVQPARWYTASGRRPRPKTAK